MLQTGTLKGPFADFGQRARQIYSAQIRAVFETLLADTLQPVIQGNVFQPVATVKGIIAQRPHTGRHDHLLKLAATAQGTVCDALGALGQDDRAQVAGIGQGIA